MSQKNINPKKNLFLKKIKFLFLYISYKKNTSIITIDKFKYDDPINDITGKIARNMTARLKLFLFLINEKNIIF